MYFDYNICIQQNDKEHENQEVNYLVESKKLSPNSNEQNESNDEHDDLRDQKSPNSVHRPDSGVGESVIFKMVYDSIFTLKLI